MSIGNRVSAALDAFDKEQYEQALHDICSAIEVTATKEAGKGGRKSYKDFITDNMVIITRCGFGVEGTFSQMSFKYDHTDVTPDVNGVCGLEQIMYHVVRCGLYHEASLPATLTFAKGNGIRCDGGKTLVLPGSLIKGLIVAVMVSPVNATETIGPQYILPIDFVNVVANKLWGKKAALTDLLNGIVAVRTAVRALEK